MKTDKTLTEIIGAVKLLSEQKRILRMFIYENCKDYVMPKEYRNKYGISIGGLTSCLLESYHQLRLKDND